MTEKSCVFHFILVCQVEIFQIIAFYWKLASEEASFRTHEVGGEIAFESSSDIERGHLVAFWPSVKSGLTRASLSLFLQLSF